jgi:L-threonylcarbamoyladenylate synthase
LRIFEIKRRPPDNPLIVHVSSLSQLDLLIDDDIEKARTIIEKFWPGPVTLIFKKKVEVPKEVTGGFGNGPRSRMPSHPVAKMLIDLSGAYPSLRRARTFRAGQVRRTPNTS